MRVLLVDDHPLFRAGLATLLERRGVQVVGQAGEGYEGVEKARQLRPDIVLMDVLMPGIGGIAATRLIKAQAPDTRVIMLTVSDEEHDLFEAIKSGADGYLLKDLQWDRFFDLLTGTSRGEMPLSSRLASKVVAEFARIARSRGPQRPHELLTEREEQTLGLVAEGLNNRDIGERLGISEHTVKYHLSHILEKLHLQNRAQVVAWAARHGVVGPEERHERNDYPSG